MTPLSLSSLIELNESVDVIVASNRSVSLLYTAYKLKRGSKLLSLIVTVHFKSVRLLMFSVLDSVNGIEIL